MKKLQLLLIVLLVSMQAAFAQTQVSGRITYADDGTPVVGATVIANGTSTAVLSDIDGDYSLTLPAGCKSILVKYTGLLPATVEANASGVYNVQMKTAALTGETVVVTGYGNVKSRNFAGSASVVTSDDTRDVPSISVADRLAGAATGVTVTSTSGQPGGKESIRIRGMGSINAGNDPLIVLDGVPMNAGNASNTNGSYDDAGMGLLSTINPADIESMTVIKDAAAASLYGSRAANGVIVITTKRGKAGKTVFNVKADAGFSEMAIDWRPNLNGQERRDLLELGFYNYGVYAEGMSSVDAKQLAADNIDDYAARPWDGYTDWQDVLFRQGFSQNYEVSAQGGNDKTKFYASLGYTDQNGLVENQDYQRITGRINLDHKTGIFTLAVGSQFSNNKQNYVSEGTSFSSPYMFMGMAGSPSYYPYNEDGTMNLTSGFLATGGGKSNPVWEREINYNKRNVNRAFNTISGQLDILEGLYVKQTLSYDYINSRESAWWDPRSNNGAAANGVMQKWSTNSSTLTSQTMANYSKTFAEKHAFSVLGAYEIEMVDKDFGYITGSNFPTYLRPEVENAAVQASSSSVDQTRLMSFVGKADYTYDNRIYVGASFRSDGSSRLAPSDRWGNFWSISSYWRIGGESWFQDGGVSNVLTDAKIRASYGENGTQPNEWYGWQGTNAFGYNYNNSAGMAENQIANPNLRWERNLAANFGVDLTFIDRITLSVDLYNRDTKDLLVRQKVSSVNGFTTMLNNVGAMNNKGIEVNAQFEAIRTKDVNWSIGLNLSHNKNELVELYGSQDRMTPNESGLLQSRVGHSYYSFYVREYAGVDPQTGSETWYKNAEIKDAQGNVTGIDRTVTSSPGQANYILKDDVNPYLTGGITTRLNYKWFDLGLTFTFSLGGNVYDANSWGNSDGGTYNYLGQVPDHFDIDKTWQKPGDIAELPMFMYGNSSAYSSDRYIYSTDHLRLKNMTIGFTAPKSWTDKLHLQKLRIFAAGNNVFTLKDKDLMVVPEVPSYGVSYFEAPQMRSFTFGIEIGF